VLGSPEKSPTRAEVEAPQSRLRQIKTRTTQAADTTEQVVGVRRSKSAAPPGGLSPVLGSPEKSPQRVRLEPLWSRHGQSTSPHAQPAGTAETAVVARSRNEGPTRMLRPTGKEAYVRVLDNTFSLESERLLSELSAEGRQEDESLFSLAAAKNLVCITKENAWQSERRHSQLATLFSRGRRVMSAASHFVDDEEDSPIDKQSVQHQSEPPWNIICNQGKSVKDIQEFIEATPEAIHTDSGFARDAAGATVLHIAVLNSRLDMVRYFMEKYGAELIKLGYDSWGNELGGFYGETALHMVIAKWGQELTRLQEVDSATQQAQILQKVQEWRDVMTQMINTVPGLLQARAIGHFFQQGGDCYYGELPLLWATSFGHPEIVEMLLSGEELVAHADLVNDHDQHGNTALHMTVVHSLPGMYSLLLDKLRRYGQKEGCIRAELCLRAILAPQNVDGLSPLTLAVSHNDSTMFQHICSHERVELWTFGPVTCCMIPLDEIDLYCSLSYQTEHQRSDPLVCSALAVASQQGHAEILEHAFINKMLQEKWKKSAVIHFYVTAAAYFALMLTLSVLVAHHAQQRHGPLTTLLEYVILAGATAFGALDLYDRFRFVYVECNHYRWVHTRWAGTGSKSRKLTRATGLTASRTRHDSFLAYGMHKLQTMSLKEPFTMCKHLSGLLELSLWCFIVCMWTHVLYGRGSANNLERTLPLAMAALFGWVYMLYFARGWQGLGHLVVTIGYMTTDVFKFMLIYTVISIAYAEALLLLIREECMEGEACPCQVSEDGGGCTLWFAWLSLLSFSIGAVSEEYFYTIKTPIYLTFSIISNVLMLNLLIALMNNTFEDVSREADKIWMRQWAHYILRVERRMPRSWQRKLRLGMPDQDTRVRRHFAKQLYMQGLVHQGQRPEDIIASGSLLKRAVDSNLFSINADVSLPELLKEPERYQYVWYETTQVGRLDTSTAEASTEAPVDLVGDDSKPSVSKGKQGLFKPGHSRQGRREYALDNTNGTPASVFEAFGGSRDPSVYFERVPSMVPRLPSRELAKVVTFKKPSRVP